MATIDDLITKLDELIAAINVQNAATEKSLDAQLHDKAMEEEFVKQYGEEKIAQWTAEIEAAKQVEPIKEP